MDWTTINTFLQPVEIGIVTASAAVAATYVGKGFTWLGNHLGAATDSARATELAALNTVAQSAMQNAAGELIGQIQAGQVDVSRISSLRAAAVNAASAAAAKIPDTIAKLAPDAGTLADMVLQKATLTAPQVMAPVPPPSTAASVPGTPLPFPAPGVTGTAFIPGDRPATPAAS